MDSYYQLLAKAKQEEPTFAMYDYINTSIIPNLQGTKILLMPESRVGTIYEWDKNVIADHWGVYWYEMVKNSKSMDEIKNILVITSTFPTFTNTDSTPSFVYDLTKRVVQNMNIRPIVLTPHRIGSKKVEIKDGIKIYRFTYGFHSLTKGSILIAELEEKYFSLA